MATATPNINLTLPAGTENVSRAILNSNFQKIDTAFGWTEIGRCTGTTTQVVDIEYTDYMELCFVLISSTTIYATSIVPIPAISNITTLNLVYTTAGGDRRTGVFDFSTKTLSVTNGTASYNFVLYAR